MKKVALKLYFTIYFVYFGDNFVVTLGFLKNIKYICQVHRLNQFV